ncbi:hypothetical protein BJ742DRAFT_825143, partial [Cladochytrium replicatum]
MFYFLIGILFLLEKLVAGVMLLWLTLFDLHNFMRNVFWLVLIIIWLAICFCLQFGSIECFSGVLLYKG